ncbi:MAG: hypothetical protein NT051_01635, partial [Candidatus Micrarchaeota archaeon]|nr:hypothetical protein [Candidatus Micrarchaeota archaeon]
KVPREERGKSWPSEREVEEFAKAAANSRLTKEMRSEAELQIAEVGKLAEFKQSVAPFINLVAGVLGTAAAIWVAVDAATLPAKELFARVLQGPLGIFTPGKGGATPEWALATLAALYFAYRVIASAYKSADGDEAWRSLNRLIEQLRGDGQ